MNIANMITILRILLIPVYLYFFYSSLRNNILFAGIIFIIAGISDVLDGYIARKYNMTSRLGIVLDPIADKLMTFTILISFTTKGIIPSWILIALGIKEIAMISGPPGSSSMPATVARTSSGCGTGWKAEPSMP